jgi:hypothetical protein
LVFRRQLVSVIGLSSARQFGISSTDTRAVTTSLAKCFRHLLPCSASLSSSSSSWSDSPSPKGRMGARTRRSIGRGRHRRHSDSVLFCSPYCDSSSACSIFITAGRSSGDTGEVIGPAFADDRSSAGRPFRGKTCGASSHLSGGGIVHHERRSHLPLSWRRSRHCPRVRECMSTAEHLRFFSFSFFFSFWDLIVFFVPCYIRTLSHLTVAIFSVLL